MKTKITFNVLILAMLISFTAHSQTHVYNESTPSSVDDLYFWSDPNANGAGSGSEVSNPKSDDVNSSDTALESGTNSGWSQIQFLNISHTVTSGDKLFFSVYDPNGVGKAQIRFEYASEPGTWADGGDVTYASGSDQGWKEVSISLSASVGEEIIKVIMMPGYDTSSAVYIDNVYFHSESVITTTPPENTTTYIYNESTPSSVDDLYFWSDPNANGAGSGSEVSNPKSDDVNSSDTALESGTNSGWSQIQFLNISHTVTSGDKLFFSVYDPNGVGQGQIRFEYASDPGTWADGGDVTYASGSDQGWKEVSFSLDASVGEEIIKVIMMPGYDTSSAVYIDNVYFSTESVLTPPPPSNTTTYIYNESTPSSVDDLYFWSDPNANGDGSGSEVSNPKSDDVNSSDTALESGTNSGWSQIQFLNISHTATSGDKLFFSVYDPNGVGQGQIRFEYASDPGTWAGGGDVTYASGSDQGWKEISFSLDASVGEEIIKVIMMPGYDTSSAVYIDNVYFNNESTLSVRSIDLLDEFVFFDTEGRINFEKNQNDSELYVFDLNGRLLIKENVEGKTSNKSVRDRGVYILKIVKEDRVSTKKLFFK